MFIFLFNEIFNFEVQTSVADRIKQQVLAIFFINKLFYFQVQSFLLYNQSLSQFCLSDLMNQLDMSICKTPTNVDNLRQLLPGMTPSLLKNYVLF